MRHIQILAALMLVLGVSRPAEGKTKITVLEFADKTEGSRCPQSSGAKLKLNSDLQAQLIAALMELDRFQIQQREIHKIKTQHALLGTIRMFELCENGRGQEVQIALDVQIINRKGSITHLLTSTARASSLSEDLAGQKAIHAAIRELAKGIDNAFPNRSSARLPLRGSRRLADNGYQIKMIKRVSRRR